MYQIIGGGNLYLAFKQLNIVADKVYEEFGDVNIQVWELDEYNIKKLSKVEDNDWMDDFGWYRDGGCNVNTNDNLEFLVNGKIMIGLLNPNSWYHSDDYLMELEEYEEEPKILEYDSFYHWFTEYYNLSTIYNACYFIETLSKLNNMSKSKFLNKYKFSY